MCVDQLGTHELEANDHIQCIQTGYDFRLHLNLLIEFCVTIKNSYLHLLDQNVQQLVQLVSPSLSIQHL